MGWGASAARCGGACSYEYLYLLLPHVCLCMNVCVRSDGYIMYLYLEIAMCGRLCVEQKKSTTATNIQGYFPAARFTDPLESKVLIKSSHQFAGRPES